MNTYIFVSVYVSVNLKFVEIIILYIPEEILWAAKFKKS